MTLSKIAVSMIPFDSRQDEQISNWGEVRLIQEIRSCLGEVCPPSPEGMGDDAAVWIPRGDGLPMVFTTDGLVWNLHFDDQATPEQAGKKLVNRNLSDLAAMGASPELLLLNLLLGPDVSKAWIRRFICGVRDASAAVDLKVVGGDVSRGAAGSFAAFATVTGKTQRAVLRSGTRDGDTLWVTGSLGGSILRHHLEFRPRLVEGGWLAARTDVHSMIDVTDGLAKDLPELVPPGCFAEVAFHALPLAADARKLAEKTGYSPIFHAWNDGEDYELCFALSAGTPPEDFHREWTKRFDLPVTRIAEVRKHPIDAPEGRRIRRKEDGAWMEAGGYHHFS